MIVHKLCDVVDPQASDVRAMREVKVPSESKLESSSVPEFKSKDHNCIQ